MFRNIVTLSQLSCIIPVTIQVESAAQKARTMRRAQTFVGQKYATSVRCAKNVVRLAFEGLSLSGLGVTPRGMCFSLLK